MVIKIKEEFRQEYETIPNLVGKTHLSLRVIKELFNCVMVTEGCEYIQKGKYNIISI